MLNRRLLLNLINKKYLSQQLNSNFADKYFATKILLDAKDKCNLKFSDLAEKLNVNKVWLTSAILGQFPIQDEQLSKKLLQILEIKKSDDEMKKLIHSLSLIPDYRGVSKNPDPIVRRFNELIDIYGNTFKQLIREEFGDGIMSAIDCNIKFDKQTQDNGEERIVITINGKYLKYKN